MTNNRFSHEDVPQEAGYGITQAEIDKGLEAEYVNRPVDIPQDGSIENEKVYSRSRNR